MNKIIYVICILYTISIILSILCIHKIDNFKKNKMYNKEELNNNVTIIVKTFLRPNCIKRFIKSVRLYYPKITILVCDDSDKPLYNNNYENDNVIWYTLPFNSGVSIGRNLLLSKVKTKYFITCDDDLIFDKNTIIDILYETIENTNFDIISGIMGQDNGYYGKFIIKNNKLYVDRNEKQKKIIKFKNMEIIFYV